MVLKQEKKGVKNEVDEMVSYPFICFYDYSHMR